MCRCIVYLVCYFILAVWTYGIQVPSGLFVPGIITGCAFGRLTGEWVRFYKYDQNCFDTFTGELELARCLCLPLAVLYSGRRLWLTHRLTVADS
jgi:H+/Cl- antiporter ClcA